MWLNIVDDFDIEFLIAYLKSLDELTTIYLSLNYLIPLKEAKKTLKKLSETLKDIDRKVYFGPHFIEEGILIDEQLLETDEIYFSTPSEKILWYQKHYQLPEDITAITLIGYDLGIEPLIVKRKNIGKKYQYCFIQEKEVSMDIASNINDQQYKLQRIKRIGANENNNRNQFT